MSELICEVIEIKDLETHNNADSLLITHIYSFPCIVKRGEIQIADKAVYFPVEACLPDKSLFSFMWKGKENPTDKNRTIRAIRLRGIFSMGLVMPLSKLVEAYPEINFNELQVGQNVAELLGVTKYEEPEPICMNGDNEPTPEWFIKYTDIQSLRKYNDLFIPGEAVVITEKVHGCFHYNTRIRMADGTTKCINKIKTNEMVMGMDKQGQAIPSKVLETFNNGKANKWLKIKSDRHGIGRGNHYGSCICTPEHLFYLPSSKKYVRADQLKVEDEILSIRRDLGLTPLQQQVLLGKILGDGFLHITPSNNIAAVVYSHINRKYTEWTTSALGEMGYERITPMPSGWSSDVFRGSSLYSYFIYQKFHDFTRDKRGDKIKKRVPEWVIQDLGPIALAFWYMDDGSIGVDGDKNPQASLATHCFDRESQDILIRALDKFNIKAKIQKTEGRMRLRIPTDSAEQLFLLVAPYIPECMQYKLPERYRGHQGWIPTGENQYKSTLLPQRILSIEDITQQVMSNRYDIKTETHNYFASDTLVHNCNGRYTYRDNRLYVGSHNNTKKLGGNDVWNVVAKKLNLEEMCKEYQDLIFFGEVYGQVQKGYGYGIKNDVSFVLFDIYDINQGKFLNYNEFFTIAAEVRNKYLIRQVPVLYCGPWTSFKNLEAMADGISVEAETNKKELHNREGFVVRLVRERFNDEIGRMILKLHGQDFLVGSKREK